MKRLLHHFPLLQYLGNLSPLEQKKLVNNSGADLIKLFNEICLNLVHRNLSLSASQIKNLKRFESEIKKLSERKHSLKLRKKVLTKGSFLKVFLVELLPSLIELSLQNNEFLFSS